MFMTFNYARLFKRPLMLSSILGLLVAAPTSLFAQSDQTVTTVRERNALGAQDLSDLNLTFSNQERYYIDTNDVLTRSTDDATRTAPGLAKNNYVAKVVPVYNTQAIEIQSYLLRSMAYEGGIVEVMGADGVTDENGRAVQFLFLTAPDFMINDLEEIVRTCDRPGFKFFDATGLDFGGGPGAVQYVGKHRTASELVAILGGTELGNVGVFLFPPFADDSTNSIYIVENPTDVADDIAALEMFDRPPLMMELEVAVYQIDDTNRGKLGVDWDVWKSFVTGSLEYSSVDLNEFFDDENDLFSTLLTLDARALVDFLSYTVQTGTTEIVTSTKLTMVNSEDNPGALSGGARGSSTGEPAVISVTTPIPFTVVQEDVGGTNSINARNEVVYDLFEGIQIKILPFIATESITLTVDVQVNSLVGFSPNADIPLIQERSLNSVVNLSNGAPVVLGGLDKQTSVKSRVGIPLLKEIPYLGLLFSKEKTETVTSKILISLTPRIKQFDSPSDTELAMGL